MIGLVVAYNPNILRDALRVRSLSHTTLSKRLGITSKELEDELNREPEPKQSVIKNIADELSLPPFVFYMEKLPTLNEAIPDFRASKPTATAHSKSTTEAIQLALSIQRTAIELRISPVTDLPFFVASSRKQIDEFSLKIRDRLGISLKDQSEANDSGAFYTICRKKIEDIGIFVIHQSFPEADGSGFCLAHKKHPIIVINTKKQTRARRLFTLIHELAHILMHQSGISDPFIQNNQIETHCNQFASGFLLPKSYVAEILRGTTIPPTPSIEQVAALARRLKVSQQATIIRLEELQLVERGSHDKWLKIIQQQGDPDQFERGGGPGRPPPQEKVKLAKYGFHFANAFDAPVKEGRISEINLFRASGLKPRYQRSYFDFVRSINNNILQDLELEDE